MPGGTKTSQIRRYAAPRRNDMTKQARQLAECYKAVRDAVYSS